MITLEVPGTDFVWWGRPKAWVSVETIQLVGMESQRGGFWPRLCLLKCNIGWELVPFISSFLNPTITNISLTLPHENHRLLQPTLSLLAHTCHQLHSLMVDADTSDPPSGGEMGFLISASRHTLRHIDIRSFTPPDIFPVIFDLPWLRALTLREPHLQDQIPPGALPRLRAINFNGNHGPNLPQFLRGIPVSRLTTVVIRYGGIIQSSSTLEALRDASATMTTLSLLPVVTLNHSDITLLCSFTNLTSLSIGCICEDFKQSGACSFQVTDENVLELGGALPHIGSLRLAPSCRAPCDVTLTSLICLSRTCGNLETLEIRVDFTSAVSGSEQLIQSDLSLGINSACPQRATSRLDTLTVGRSPLPDLPRCEWVVALALVRIFPSIRVLSCYCAEEMRKRWEEVSRDILVCQKIFRITQATGKHLSTCV